MSRRLFLIVPILAIPKNSGSGCQRCSVGGHGLGGSGCRRGRFFFGLSLAEIGPEWTIIIRSEQRLSLQDNSEEKKDNGAGS